MAIERHPRRAARLRELERFVSVGDSDPMDAVTEIRQIREAAEAEAGLRCTTGPGTSGRPARPPGAYA
ncbi:hypothetical protein [Streptomyces sp. G45]|uniref:hypothetical protein n=1 Tax=Streptomyces sp. G45 TaxID=3406627 RepID=UPI003C152EAF